jgi:hypothetical protein
MKFGMPPSPTKPKLPVKVGGQKSSKARSVKDDGETRGRSALAGRLGQMLGSTGKGPPPAATPPKRLRTPKGPGMGPPPGISGPGSRPPKEELAIGERAQLGARTKAALAKRRGR